MIVLGANLTMDRTLSMERLIPGHVMRPRTAVATGGGKAVNVCRAAWAHGVRPRLVANLPGRWGDIVGDMLEAEGHDLRRVPTSGEIRSAIVILEDDGRATVLNEPGPDLTAADRRALIDALDDELGGAAAVGRPHRVLVASGSLPPGDHATGLYAEVVERAHAHRVPIVLDAARADLDAALPAHPDIVTPNLSEALAVLGSALAGESVEPDLPDVRRVALAAASALRAAGARAALVTVGRHGVAGAYPLRPGSVAGSTSETSSPHPDEITFWVDAPTVREVNPIGAGDSFAAGLAVGLDRGLSLPEATVLAVATGAASVATELAGGVDPDLLAALIDQVTGP
ncbi:MAG: bifunctional hydroxymethylpyrimidine kinase/phosphomethylpyrimidine kinase [Kineosporiaceae bacterium]|nr:bifunctional hydroxymethylpyrimidine kinase/phosphomethylpyrimidine kinase [Kineosporiaceae bacterium]